jgi:hypothetical protein
MDNRTEVFPDREVFGEMLAALMWYENMPSSLGDVVGDRFHEHLDNYTNEKILPLIPEVANEDDEFFIGSVSTGILTDDQGTHDVIEVDIIRTGEDNGHVVTFK